MVLVLDYHDSSSVAQKQKMIPILRGGLQIELEMVLVLDYHDSSSVAQKQKMIQEISVPRIRLLSQGQNLKFFSPWGSK